MKKDFHGNPFGEGTQIKLWLYGKYINAWLPVFMTNSEKMRVNAIRIYDLMCGPGQDPNDLDGSPLILLKQIYRYFKCKATARTPIIKIHFNDESKDKIEHLRHLVSTQFPSDKRLEIHYTNEPVDQILPNIQHELSDKNSAKFVFIDQCGIKELSSERVRALSEMPITDWLYFVASSTVHRFKEHPAITDKICIKEHCKRKHIHRKIAELCGEWTLCEDYYIVPFSIMKGSNIYGLIFGSKHPLGADKFLTACWIKDPAYGEANYNIEGEASCSNLQYSLLPNTKVERFKNELIQSILSGNIKTNKEVFIFALKKGFTNKHSKEVLSKMKKDGTLKNSRIPGVSYSTIFKTKNIVLLEI